MNNAESNSLINVLWSKETAFLIMTDWTWKTDQLKAQLKSPYPFLFFDYINPEILNPPEIQPEPNPNP